MSFYIPTNRYTISICPLCCQHLLFSFYNTQPERWYLPVTWFLFHWYLVMLITMPINIGHFSVFYEEISIEAFYTFFFYFLKSVICLLLVWSWAVVVAIYSEYWPIMQIQSLQILLLIPSICLSADCWGDHLSSHGNFRTLAKIIWPHMCEFIQDSILVIYRSLCLFCCR